MQRLVQKTCRLDLVQDLERKESARRVSSIGKKYLITRTFTKNDDTYSLLRTGLGVCSNKLECVTFASSRNFKQGSTPREGALCNFLNFLRKSFPSRADFGCERTKDVAAYR